MAHGMHEAVGSRQVPRAGLLRCGAVIVMRVRAVNARGAGAWSSSTIFRTTSGLLAGNGSAWKDANVWIGPDTWIPCRVWTGNGTEWK